MRAAYVLMLVQRYIGLPLSKCQHAVHAREPRQIAEQELIDQSSVAGFGHPIHRSAKPACLSCKPCMQQRNALPSVSPIGCRRD